MPVLSGRLITLSISDAKVLVVVYNAEIVSWLGKLHFFLFCFDFVTWFCHNLKRQSSFLRERKQHHLFSSRYIFMPFLATILLEESICCDSVVHKKNSLHVKTFVFFISLHTYNKFGRVTENEKEKVACIADFQISF